jgi:AcrR family transcriptional regulator
MTDAGSLRDRKKADTRTSLHRAALELVGQHGLAHVSVDDIAERAGVSPRTFFNYFRTKEDAVAGWDPDRVAALCDALVAADPKLTAFDALRDVLLSMFETLVPDREDLLARLRVIHAEPLLHARQAMRFSELERDLSAAVARRRGHREADDPFAALMVATTLAACRVAVMAWGRDGGQQPLEEFVAQALQYLATGIGDPAGKATLF